MRSIENYLPSRVDFQRVYSPVYRSSNDLLVSLNAIKASYNKNPKTLTNRVCSVAQIVFAYIAGVANIVTSAIYSTIFFNSRLQMFRDFYQNGCKEDLGRITPEDTKAVNLKIEADIETYMPTASPKEKIAFANQILTYHARSQTVYGPILRLWVESLLEKANVNDGKLVFMARDGIAPYEVAKALMQTEAYQAKFPNLCKGDAITLVYFSRKVVNWAGTSEENKATMNSYIEQQIPGYKTKNLFFVDIGFTGSMIPGIMKFLNVEGADKNPERVKFEYLISHNPKVHGFIADAMKPLAEIQSAGSNLAVHWLEDSHQGNELSPKMLVKDEVTGRIGPNVHKAKNEPSVTQPLQFLLRKYAFEASVDGAVALDNDDILRRDAEIYSLFIATIRKVIKEKLPLFIEH